MSQQTLSQTIESFGRKSLTPHTNLKEKLLSIAIFL
jgi:hypothetical protein